MKRVLPWVFAALLLGTPAAAAPATRAITVEDVVQTRQFTEITLSPDGRRVAVVVTEPSVATNQVTSRVLVADAADSGRTGQVAELSGTAARITNLRWSPDGRTLAYLAPIEGAAEIWQVPASGGTPRRLIGFDGPAVAVGGENLAFRQSNIPPHQAKMLAFEFSPDGRTVAFTTPRPVPSPPGEGVVFDSATMDLRTVESHQFQQVRNGLWLADLHTGAKRHVLDSVQGPLSGPGGPGMAWSPDGSRLAFVTLPSQQPTGGKEALNVVEAASGKLSTVDTPGLDLLPAVWSSDGRSVLAFARGKLVTVTADGRPTPLADLPAGARSITAGRWAGDRLFATLTGDRRESLHVLAGGAWKPVSSTPDDLSRCAIGQDRAVCVRQNAGTPPRLSTVDLNTGGIRDGFDPNGWIGGVRFQRPEPVEWTNSAGVSAPGYRLVPPGCGPVRRCPAIVITHGYDARERFMSDRHEWQYPSQVFAASGYVVLLVNEPATTMDPAQAVKMAEAAVLSEVDSGTVDRARVGIAGYSRGAQIAEEALVRSELFRTASAGEGGSGLLMPWAEPKVHGSLLQQGGPGVGSLMLSIHDAVRQQQTSRLVMFPAETHIFHQPAHRAAAMRQNLAWFGEQLA